LAASTLSIRTPLVRIIGIYTTSSKRFQTCCGGQAPHLAFSTGWALRVEFLPLSSEMTPRGSRLLRHLIFLHRYTVLRRIYEFGRDASQGDWVLGDMERCGRARGPEGRCMGRDQKIFLTTLLSSTIGENGNVKSH
jgi:hypothetical protein